MMSSRSDSDYHRTISNLNFFCCFGENCFGENFSQKQVSNASSKRQQPKHPSSTALLLLRQTMAAKNESSTVLHMHPEARGRRPSSLLDDDGLGKTKGNNSRVKLREGLKFAVLVLVYYFSNSFVILTNKQLISKMDFHFPIMLTALHMITACFFSFVVLDVLQLFKKQTLTKTSQKQKIMFLALIFCISIVCGNWSLRFIHVSFMEVREDHFPPATN